MNTGFRIAVFLGLANAFCGAISTRLLAEDATKGGAMSYAEARDYLVQHTKVLELTDEHGARVLICPEWQGRVMTSTCGGPEGLSFGFINSGFIDAGQPNPHFNNYGGEDRFWLSPEGGQFSLWFAKGAAQNLDNWFTPPALNEGAWRVISGANDPFYRMAQRMKLTNASGTQFELDVIRDIRLLSQENLSELFGAKAAEQLRQPSVKLVSYETINRVINVGTTWTREGGLMSIWILGMFNAGPQTVVIVPYRPGEESELGPIVKSDYFGEIPPERLKILPTAILFLGDGNYRSKIGTSQKRAKNVAGSIDFVNGVLTLVQFSMPEQPTDHPYMNNMWELPQKEPYIGDVANSYNDGPAGPDKPGLGPFYEIESLSLAAALPTGGRLEHRHRTVHVQGDYAVLKAVAQEVLGVDLDEVRKAMFSQ